MSKGKKFHTGILPFNSTSHRTAQKTIKAENRQETTSQFILWLTDMFHQTIDVAQHYRAKVRFLSTDSVFLDLHQRKLLVFLLENLQLRKRMTEKVRLTFIFQYPHHIQHLLIRVMIWRSQEARDKITPALFNHGFQQRNSENNVKKKMISSTTFKGEHEKCWTNFQMFKRSSWR